MIYITVKDLKAILDTLPDNLQVHVSSDGSNVTPVAEVNSCVDMNTNKMFCYIGGAWRGKPILDLPPTPEPEHFYETLSTKIIKH